MKFLEMVFLQKWSWILAERFVLGQNAELFAVFIHALPELFRLLIVEQSLSIALQ
jgi:hypothetical protein